MNNNYLYSLIPILLFFCFLARKSIVRAIEIVCECCKDSKNKQYVVIIPNSHSRGTDNMYTQHNESLIV